MLNKILKSVLSLVALVLVSVDGNATNFENNLPTTTFENVEKVEDAALIKIKLEFGRVSRDCSGFGICDLSANINVGIVEIDVIVISKNAMTASVSESNQNTIKEYFGENAFILEEDFEVTDVETKELLGVNNLTMKKGVYRIENGRVSFNVIQK